MNVPRITALPGATPGARGPSFPSIAAHRGYHAADETGAGVRENSLESVVRATKAGAEWVELDVRRTVDDVLVLNHGGRFAGERIASSTLEALAAAAARRGEPRLTTLTEAARVIAESGSGLIADVKVGGAERDLVRELKLHLPPERVKVVSFRPDVLEGVEQLDPRIETGLLAPEYLTGRFLRPGHWPTSRQLLNATRRAGADFIAVHQTFLGANLLERAEKAGLDTWVWTVDEPERLGNYLRDPRIAGIITDQPTVAARTRAEVVADG